MNQQFPKTHLINSPPGRVASCMEFFAGGGMVRAGLGRQWSCIMANEIDPAKSTIYRQNWGPEHNLVQADIRDIQLTELTPRANLAWASFPCQDLSLAGQRAGLDGSRSSTLHAFWDHISHLSQNGKVPDIVAIENVTGTLTSAGGRDFERICHRFAEEGYLYGALVIDAALFLPQSRPRLFVIGVRSDLFSASSLPVRQSPGNFHTRGLQQAISGFDSDLLASWLWWDIPLPPPRTMTLMDSLEDDPVGVLWNSPEQTERLLGQMDAVNQSKVHLAQAAGKPMVGAVYRRTRNVCGVKTLRAEVRFDGLAGCLRTPAGGSSRQTLLLVHGSHIRSRLLSPREGARLMGLPDSYHLPQSYSEVFRLLGDGVVVPVVRHLDKHLFKMVP